MADTRVRIPKRASVRTWPFNWDVTVPAEKACADYILKAPSGFRMARMRKLILMGYRALQERHHPKPQGKQNQ